MGDIKQIFLSKVKKYITLCFLENDYILPFSPNGDQIDSYYEIYEEAKRFDIEIQSFDNTKSGSDDSIFRIIITKGVEKLEDEISIMDIKRYNRNNNLNKLI